MEEEVNGTYKLISDLIIDCQMYYSSEEERIIDGKTIYANNYQYSDVRSWLNNEFINKAFTKTLQEYIKETEVDNSVSSTGYSANIYMCENTMDKIYLPSYKGMKNEAYGDSDSSSSDTARQKQLTDYAKAMGCYSYMNINDYYNNGYYWLRSPDNYFSSYACNVSYIGYMLNNYGLHRCKVNDDCRGVAPALTIQID